ncbi:MAG: hypothetical protein HOC71_07200 [Candidatus Latescibacteria bacterium]|jgi:DNA repair exonuclease SbcCD nuclease subunit|nr:hypothetical protein [Candidatus Latescibacterota bacterium]
MPCRFIVISDTHFVAPPADREGTWWNRTTHRYSQKMGEALVELVSSLAPDFVIHCGDLTGWDSKANCELSIEFMDKLGCPWYGTPGNHDTQHPHGRELFNETFGLNGRTWSYLRDVGGLRFFFLDVVHWHADSGESFPFYDMEQDNSGRIVGMGYAECDLVWLERELEQTNRPSVIVTHAPICFRDTYPLKTLPYGKPVMRKMTPPSEFINDMIGRKKLSELIRGNSSVKACFAGHWHINDAVVSDGVLYVMTGALREFPYEVRLVEYTGSSLCISTHSLNVPELREISFVKEWNNEWVKGEQDVRNIIFTFL